jgi:hypothetical protein
MTLQQYFAIENIVFSVLKGLSHELEYKYLAKIGSQICFDHSLTQLQLLSITCAEVTFLF